MSRLPENAKYKKNDKGSRKVRRQMSDEEKFQQEWERVARLQEQNHRFRDELDNLLQRVGKRIKTEESQRAELHYALIRHLINFVGRRSLPEYLRAELVDWVYALMIELQANPFVEQMNLTPLNLLLDEQFQAIQEFEYEKLQKRLARFGTTPEDLGIDQPDNPDHAEDNAQPERDDPETEDMFEDLFEEFLHELNDAEENADGIGLDAEDFEDFENFGGGPGPSQHVEAELDQLVKNSPVNQLFRKIARVLHPDLETDEQKKTSKNEQMGKLLQARKQKDIATIIALYIEHVGELPPNIFGGSLDSMTRLLKYQTQRLREEKDAILFEDPIKAAVHGRFASKNQREFDRKIAAHQREIKKECQSLATTMQAITSVKSLRPYLEVRHSQSFFSHDDDLDALFDWMSH